MTDIDKGTRGRSRLESQVAGALRSCIDAHGPITKAYLGSAAKRAVAAVAAFIKESENG